MIGEAFNQRAGWTTANLTNPCGSFKEMGKHDNPPSMALSARRRMSFLCGVTDGSDASLSVVNHCEDSELSGQLRITIFAALNRLCGAPHNLFDVKSVLVRS